MDTATSPVDSRTLWAVALTLLFWSSSFAGIRAGLEWYSPGPMALFRFLVASLMLVAHSAFFGVRLPQVRDLPFIFFAGFLGIAFYHVSLNYGEVTVTAGSASFLIGTVPIFSALLAAAILKERPAIRAWAGIGISFAGITLIALGEGEGKGLSLDLGALLILASAIATSVFFVLQKPYLAKYGALNFTKYSFWAATGFMMVFLPGLVTEVQVASAHSTLSVIYLGVFPTAISYVAFAYALSRSPVSLVTSFMYISPVLACLIAWVWLGEVPSAVSFIGGLMALVGVVLVNTRSAR
ncbi:DMT family transporter [Thermodesulfobacteriota bacterium]